MSRAYADGICAGACETAESSVYASGIYAVSAVLRMARAERYFK